MATGVNHSERRRFVVSRALSLFARMGYSKVSFLTISEATGIARTALYRYFKTKREIFDEAILEVTSTIASDLRAVSCKEMSVSSRMEQACILVMEAIHHKKEFFQAIFDFVFSMVRTGEDMTARIEDFTGGFRVVLRQLLAEGVENGELKSSVDPDTTAEALFSLMESFALRVLLGVEKDVVCARNRFRMMISALAAG
jgi:AcrR family transcriptional regulator